MVLLVEGYEAQTVPFVDHVRIQDGAVPVAHLIEPARLQYDVRELGGGGHR